jgi:hypothetical protein
VKREIRDLIRQMSSANPLWGLVIIDKPEHQVAPKRELLGDAALISARLSYRTVRRQNLLDKFALELREDLVHLS